MSCTLPLVWQCLSYLSKLTNVFSHEWHNEFPAVPERTATRFQLWQAQVRRILPAPDSQVRRPVVLPANQRLYRHVKVHPSCVICSLNLERTASRVPGRQLVVSVGQLRSLASHTVRSLQSPSDTERMPATRRPVVPIATARCSAAKAASRTVLLISEMSSRTSFIVPPSNRFRDIGHATPVSVPAGFPENALSIHSKRGRGAGI